MCGMGRFTPAPHIPVYSVRFRKSTGSDYFDFNEHLLGEFADSHS